jgi:hypothetical protein
MARGFESKAVAEQQEAALSGRRAPGVADPNPARTARRRTLELARADVLHRLQAAQAPDHRQMLDRALAALDEELAGLA